MDLDKLKKTALDKTIKIFRDGADKEKQDTKKSGGKFDEFAEQMDVLIDETPDDASDLGSTRRFRLREVLGGLMRPSEESDESPSDAPQAAPPETVPQEDTPAAPPVSAEPEPVQPCAVPAVIPDELISRIDDIKNGIDELRGTAGKDSSAEQELRLDDITRRLSSIKKMLEKQSDNTTKSVVNINAKLNAQDDRITDIISSLGSVSKLNDSIFDLKNAQMNTRNSIDQLETSFSRLRRKMTAGITVLSILSAVLIVLEVLNLLS